MVLCPKDWAAPERKNVKMGSNSAETSKSVGGDLDVSAGLTYRLVEHVPGEFHQLPLLLQFRRSLRQSLKSTPPVVAVDLDDWFPDEPLEEELS